MAQPDEQPALPTEGDAPTSARRGHHRRHGAIVTFIIACRPKQWLKNVLVFAAPAAAGKIFVPSVLTNVVLMAAAFVLTSSGIYLLNDLKDLDADRHHPTKRFRPIASGELAPTRAALGALILLVLGNVLPFVLLNGASGLVVLAYSAITLAYNYYLKREAVLDIAAVAIGFLLRAMSGGVAAHLPLSNWFLIVASFGSLFMVSGKRYSELKLLGEEAGRHRRALDTYSTGYLNFIRALSAGVMITGYCIWAFDKAAHGHGGALAFQLSIIPFVLGVLKYSLVIEEGLAGAPEEVVLSDRTLVAIGFLWALLMGIGVILQLR